MALITKEQKAIVEANGYQWMEQQDEEWPQEWGTRLFGKILVYSWDDVVMAMLNDRMGYADKSNSVD